MKIILATSEFPPAKTGYAKIAFELSRWFEAAGHDVQILTLGRGCKRIRNFALVLTDEGKAMLNEGCDILQIIGPSPLFTEQCVKYGKKAGLKVVYTANGFPGLSSYYANPLVKAVDSLYRRLYFKKAIKKIDIGVFNTKEYAAYYGKLYKGQHAIIPYGINETDLTVTKGDGRTSEMLSNRILFVGQLRRYKGVAYLLQAIHQLRRNGFNCHLDIVGEGPERRKLERTISDLHIEDSVSLLGAIDNVTGPGLSDVYSRANVLVLPSISQPENFGIVLLEARAHGLNIIASDLLGVRELARSLGGRLVPVRDSRALSDALRQELAHPRTATPVPDLSRFLWRTIAQEYLQLYEDLASEASSSRGLQLSTWSNAHC